MWQSPYHHLSSELGVEVVLIEGVQAYRIGSGFVSQHAFILGGTGQIGRAMTRNFLDAGWHVTVAHRGLRALPDELVDRGAKVVVLDRETPDELPRALGSGADALIDVTAFGPNHGRQLLSVERRVGAFAVISSCSVYRDDNDRTLDDVAQTGFPDLPEPIPETQPTVAPGPTSYSRRKVALEHILLDDAKVPVTILRPAAIYGLGSVHPREWWLIKRILDRRKAIPLAFSTSRFHTTSAANIAEVARVSLEAKGSRILNIADPTAPNVAEIATLIAQHMHYSGQLVEVAGDVDVGFTPWSGPNSVVLDTSAALALGYIPVSTYGDSIGSICDGLAEAAVGRDWREIFPAFARYPAPFDYELEDGFFGGPNDE